MQQTAAVSPAAAPPPPAQGPLKVGGARAFERLLFARSPAPARTVARSVRPNWGQSTLSAPLFYLYFILSPFARFSRPQARHEAPKLKAGRQAAPGSTHTVIRIRPLGAEKAYPARTTRIYFLSRSMGSPNKKNILCDVISCVKEDRLHF